MADAGTVTMSQEELNRLEVLHRVLERRLTQARVDEQLGLSLRQVERLWRKLRLEGADGLVSKKRGRPGNPAGPPAVPRSLRYSVVPAGVRRPECVAGFPAPAPRSAVAPVSGVTPTMPHAVLPRCEPSPEQE